MSATQEDVSKALGTSGGGVIVRALGREWTLTPPSIDRLDEWKSWRESVARRNLVAARRQLLGDETLTPEEREGSAAVYEDLARITSERIDTGYYSWEKPGTAEQLRSVEGMVRFMWLLVKERHPHVTTAYVEKLLRAEPEAFKSAVEECVRRARPNGEAPEEGA